MMAHPLIGLPELFAAGATGVALVILGAALLAMQVGELLSGAAARNPAASILQSVFGVALATLGLDLLVLVFH